MIDQRIWCSGNRPSFSGPSNGFSGSPARPCFLMELPKAQFHLCLMYNWGFDPCQRQNTCVELHSLHRNGRELHRFWPMGNMMMSHHIWLWKHTRFQNIINDLTEYDEPWAICSCSQVVKAECPSDCERASPAICDVCEVSKNKHGTPRLYLTRVVWMTCLTFHIVKMILMMVIK